MTAAPPTEVGAAAAATTDDDNDKNKIDDQDNKQRRRHFSSNVKDGAGGLTALSKHPTSSFAQLSQRSELALLCIDI